MLLVAVCAGVLDGLLAGERVALRLALRGSGEPGIPMGVRDYVIWFLVLAMVGVVNAVGLYAVNALVARRTACNR